MVGGFRADPAAGGAAGAQPGQVIVTATTALHTGISGHTGRDEDALLGQAYLQYLDPAHPQLNVYRGEGLVQAAGAHGDESTRSCTR